MNVAGRINGMGFSRLTEAVVRAGEGESVGVTESFCGDASPWLGRGDRRLRFVLARS